MPELTVAPDPSIWSLVPRREDAPAWVHRLTGALPDEQKVRAATAAELALQTREKADDGLVLLLSEPASGLYAALTILVAAAPAITDAERASELALTVTPSPWPPTIVPFELGGRQGWRVSVLIGASDENSTDAESGERSATVLEQAITTYVFALADHLAVAHLSPLAPTGASIAMALTEQLLPTLEASGIA